MSTGGLGWFFSMWQRTRRRVNLAPISPRPHTVRHELGCVSTWWIVSHCGHCCGRARPAAVASSFAQHVGLGPAPWCCFSVCCIVSGPLWGVLRSALCSLLGGIVPLRCACLCYWPVCQDSRSFLLRDPLVPTVAGPPTSSPWLPNQAGECVRFFVREGGRARAS